MSVAANSTIIHLLNWGRGVSWQLRIDFIFTLICCQEHCSPVFRALFPGGIQGKWQSTPSAPAVPTQKPTFLTPLWPREVCVCVCRYGNSPAANFSVILLHYFMQIIPRKDQHIKKNYKKMNAAHIGCHVKKLKK